MKAITTIPPYAPYLKQLSAHPMVGGFRLNTVMPTREPLDEMLIRLKDIAGNKKLYIDLKCRQLRVSGGAYFNAPTEPKLIEVDGKKVYLDPSKPRAYGEIRAPPWSILELDHEIELDCSKPVRCYFNDGLNTASIAQVDGNRVIMLDGPRSLVGKGESMNILHPSLKIKGYLTERDKEYIAASRKAGIHDYMASFVEQDSDISDIIKLDEKAQIVAKIESKKGLEWVANSYDKYKEHVRLMAARGDLYVEVGKPHKILNAMKQIIRADPKAIAASRIMPSLRDSAIPDCCDICDIGYLREIGYQNLMVGDDICFEYDSIFSALNVLEAIDNDYTTG